MAASDRFTLEIIQDSLVALGQEMFDAMLRTSMSPIIYEATDFAVGVTDAHGNLIAQGNGVASFLAVLDTAVQATLAHFPQAADIRPGDVVITNVPYEGGGTHLNDVVVVVPIFHGERLIAWTANKGHWTELGGAQAGSVSTCSTEIFQEGLQFPFVKLYEAGRINKSIVALIRANVRLPESTLGDMHAAVASCRVGGRRIVELADKYGTQAVVEAMEAILDYGERMTRAELRRLPPGVYEAEDLVEGDGLGAGPFHIKARVTISAHKMIADFTGTSGPAPGPINCSLNALVTGLRCVFKAAVSPDLTVNGGCFRAFEVVCPPGTLISAIAPAPVSLYFEPRNAAMDVMWKALAPIVPDRLPAGHQRSVNSTFVSGVHPESGQLFVCGEPLVGGWGGSRRGDGDGGQFASGNAQTYNIPVELFEARYGLRVEQYAFHTEDGGVGQHRGGKGVLLDYRVIAEEVFLTYATSRSAVPPWGLNGGGPGSFNNVKIFRRDGSVETHSMCTRLRVVRGELIRLTTATGGGFGDARLRPREAVLLDLKNGYLTAAQAQRDYGVVA